MKRDQVFLFRGFSIPNPSPKGIGKESLYNRGLQSNTSHFQKFDSS